MGPALVIGGGPAGAGLAIRLAQAGRAVVVLEREAGPHDKVCGEFLSYEVAGSLHRLGLDPVALGAVAVDKVAVCSGARRAVAALPFAALSLSRRAMDEALLTRAAAVGAEVRRGVRVTGLEPDGPGWRALADDGATFAATEVFLATGKHDLRGWKRPPGRQSDLIGFKTHLRLAPAMAAALDRAVELHLFPGGYAGLELVEGGRANLCLVVRQATFSAWGGRWEALYDLLLHTCPHLAERLEGAVAQTARPLAIAAIPYGHVRDRADGLWRLGDQAAVIPSFAGEGMAIALHSAELAAGFVLSGRGPDAFQRTLAGHVRAQVRATTLVSQALVRAPAQAAIGAALSVAPGLARLVARRTRLSDRAQAELHP
ncbi:MAG TPA: FAD-dependent monooxygenase [Caulobacteraceae bacterium]|jgi:flavin-dependent dehydrogenase|nr:FAD-dependent monooxygenase [Caulobacteraceae bacterium]